MSELNTDARKVLHTINDLHFAGRPAPSKAGCGNERVYFKSVPIFILHAEFFPYSFDLDSTLELLKTEEAVIQIVYHKFQSWKYIRPDDKTVVVKCLFNGGAVSHDVTVDDSLVRSGSCIAELGIDCYEITKAGRGMLNPKDNVATTVPPKTLMSPTVLSEHFKVPLVALRERLKRFRKTSHTGWIENTENTAQETKYQYEVGAVMCIIDKLKTTSKRPTKNT